MDVQDHATPSGLTCPRCGWQFSGPNPSSEECSDHKRVCGTVEGLSGTMLVDDEVVFDDEYQSGDEEKEMTPSPNIEKKKIKESSSSADGVEEKSNRSEDDMFSAGTEFSDTGISPGVTSVVKKVDDKSEVFESTMTHSKDADKVPLFEDRDESHEEKVIDQMEFSNTVQDQGEDFYELSVASGKRLVDEAETLLEDVKDHKRARSNVSSDNEQSESRSIVDVFEDKSVLSVHESQPSDHKKSSFEEHIVTGNLSEAEASHDKRPGVTLGELIEAEIKEAEVDHSVPVLTESAVSGSKDSVKAGSSETMVGEGSGKVLTGQRSGVGASFCSSGNSLEGIWGSVSDISDVFRNKSEKRLDRSYGFKDSSVIESEEEIVDKNASEVNAVKVQKTRSPKSEANEDSITKVTNWSTSGHIATAPLRRLMGEAKSPSPKPSSSVIKKDEDDAQTSQPGKSNVTQETPVVNQESSAVIDSGEGKLVKKKTTTLKSSLGRFVCCSDPDTK